MLIPDTMQDMLYSSCPECRKIIKALGNEEIRCNNCNQKVIACPRYKVTVQLNEIPDIITSTMFGKCAESLVRRTPSQIHHMTAQELQELLTHTNNEIQGQKVIVQIRPSDKIYADGILRYIVIEWTKQNMHGKTTPATSEVHVVGKTPEKQEGKRSTPTSNVDPKTAALKKVKLEIGERK